MIAHVTGTIAGRLAVAPLAPGYTVDPVIRHQARRTVAADRLTLKAQRLLHARRPDDVVAVGMNRSFGPMMKLLWNVRIDGRQPLPAKAGVMLVQVNATPRFQVIVRRSFADHLWRWLDYPLCQDRCSTGRE